MKVTIKYVGRAFGGWDCQVVDGNGKVIQFVYEQTKYRALIWCRNRALENNCKVTELL